MITGVQAVGRTVLVRPPRTDRSTDALWVPPAGAWEVPVVARIQSVGPDAIDVFPFVHGMSVVISKYAGTAFGIRAEDATLRWFYALQAEDILAIWTGGGFLIPIGDRVIVRSVPEEDVGERMAAAQIAVTHGDPEFYDAVAGRVSAVSAFAIVRVDERVHFSIRDAQEVTINGDVHWIVPSEKLLASSA